MSAVWVPDSEGMRSWLMKDPELNAALRAQAEAVVGDAQRIAPVRTGHYRDSLHAERITDGPGVRVVSDVVYAPFLEFGTRYLSPRHILARAVRGGTS